MDQKIIRGKAFPGKLINKFRTARFIAELAFKRYIRRDFGLRPIVAELFLTQNCNLQCISCACWRSKTTNELSYDEWIDIIDQLENLGFIKLNFTGGEPLLRTDTIDIIRYASQNTRASWHLNTNALLLTPNRIMELIEAGVYSYNISIDSANPETHDAIRGQKGAFEKTTKNLSVLLALRNTYPIKVRMCCTVMNRNVDELAEAALFAQQHKIQLFFNMVTDHTFLFRNNEVRDLANINVDALIKNRDQLLALKRKNPRYLPSYSAISNLEDHFKDVKQESLLCAESQIKLMIHSQGQIGGCWGEDPLHSLRIKKLGEIFNSKDFIKRQSLLYWKQCRGCGSNNSLNMRLSPRHLLKSIIHL
jgi:MoaA/NifB/PqqE/SkfB family radical SAM enzyme